MDVPVVHGGAGRKATFESFNPREEGQMYTYIQKGERKRDVVDENVKALE